MNKSTLNMTDQYRSVFKKIAILQKFKQADYLYKQGNFSEAEQLYSEIIETDPGQFDALHRLGILSYKKGQYADAHRYIGAALEVSPNEAPALSDFGLVQATLDDLQGALASYDAALVIKSDLADVHCRRGDVLKKLDRHGEAIASYDRALELNPHFAQALNNRGLTLMDIGRPLEALASYERLLAFSPDDLLALCNRGRTLQDLKRPEDALASYDRALILKPDYLEVLNNRGVLLQDFNRLEEALACFDRVLAVKPDYIRALNNRGDLLRKLNRPEEALATYDQVLGLEPHSAEALSNRGLVLFVLNRSEEALSSLDQALTLNPHDARAFNVRGLALLSLNRPAEALASYDQALVLTPDFADALGNKGMLLTELGRFEEAREAIERSIALAPHVVRAYYNLTLSKRIEAGSPHFRAMQDLALGMAALAPDDQIHLHYALGKAFADIGDHASSFPHLLAGAALKRKQTPYDEAATLAGFQRTCGAFGEQRMERDKGLGEPSGVPVFIVGMPRSGTSLVEQILASHPQAFAAGETDAFAGAVQDLDDEAAPNLSEPISLTSSQGLLRLGENYLRRISATAPTAQRITNKTPDNFRFLGLIHLAMPNARIIHIRRDPLDTCLSCFSKLFGGDLPYTYDLAELGRYYRAYEAMMAHWRRVLPQGVMLDVRYEDIVGGLEGQARRIVAHCGLDWNARCLDFHLTERWVHTASATQVRQPIYQSSVGRWRALEAFLKPLIAELERDEEKLD